MIWDCFIFFNEFDVLDIRFKELYPVVDKFILVEANMTFSGNAKPYNFAAHRERYAQYMDKIVYYNLQIPPEVTDPWEREAYQRNAIAYVIAKQGPPSDTIIILSDADEIPRRSVVESLKTRPTDQFPLSMWLKKFSYSINVLTTEQHGSVKAFPYHFLIDLTLQDIRKTDIHPYIKDAGWEFSSLGTAGQVSEKMKSFSHTELDVQGISDPTSIQQRIHNLEDVAGRGYKHQVVEIDDTWPETIKENPGWWSRLKWTE